MSDAVATGVTAIALVGVGLLASWLTVQLCARRCLHRRRARWRYSLTARQVVEAQVAWAKREAERDARAAEDDALASIGGAENHVRNCRPLRRGRHAGGRD